MERGDNRDVELCPHGNARGQFSDPCSRTIAAEKVLSFRDPLFREKQTAAFDEGKRSHPYEILLPRGTKEPLVTFLGVHHTYSPESTMVQGVEEKRDQYLAAIPKEKQLFMIEGMHSGVSAETLPVLLEHCSDASDAIRTFGEKGALLWTAHTFGIPIASPEAPEEQIVEKLCEQGYAQEELALFLVLRILTNTAGRKERVIQNPLMHFAREFFHVQELSGVSWISAETKNAVLSAVQERGGKEIEPLLIQLLEEWIIGVNTACARYLDIEGGVLVSSIAALQKQSDEVPQSERIPLQDVNELFDPVNHRGRMNVLSASWNGERDKYILEKIIDALAEGKQPLVVYGGSHAVALEPALEEVVQQFYTK